MHYNLFKQYYLMFIYLPRANKFTVIINQFKVIINQFKVSINQFKVSIN